MIQPTITFDKIQLFNADNMEVMKQYPDKYFDIGIIDPPYGLKNKLVDGGTWSVKWQKKGADWDVAPTKEYFDELFRISKDFVIFGANYFIEFLPNCRNFIAWHKPYMDGMHSMSNVELALTSFDMNAKKISINKDKGGEERIHLTQKPVALYSWIIKHYVKPNMKILDTHLGSGSQTIAIDKANTIENMNLEFVGIEIDSEYFNDSVQRFKNYKQQKTIFD